MAVIPKLLVCNILRTCRYRFSKFSLHNLRNYVTLLTMVKNAVNQKSIAESLNLSVATVSKALSDSVEINAENREKVVNMATKMGYRYTGGSRRKDGAEGKSHFVGVLIHSNPDQWQETAYFAGMSEKCAKLNVSLMLHYFSTADCEQVLDPANQPPVMRDGQLSGLILVNRWPTYIVKELVAKMPCVSIVHRVPEVALDLVGIDNTDGISRLMDHLHGLGHRRIGFFGRCGEITWSRARFGAYTDSLCRLGLEFEPECVCDISLENVEDKTPVLDAQVDDVVVQVRRGVRAWMCANDLVGYLLCRGLMERGFRIPQDVSITGFDYSQNDRLGCPKLTSMAVPFLKIGAEALRRLISRVHHPNRPQYQVRLQCKFVEGMTSAGPPLEEAQERKEKNEI